MSRPYLNFSILFGLIAIASMPTALAQLCPAAPQCRESAPRGKLLHAANSKGELVWTTSCGPNTNAAGEDPICTAISKCPEAGGFGKFLQAVTFQCKSKHFASYYGLDGMTFGILDWTSSNLPGILKAYQQRAPAGFDRDFARLHLPMRDGCLDTSWTCNANKQAELMCKTDFRSSFAAAISTGDFRKAEMDYARLQYEERLRRFAYLGLKTEFGNTAMAVLANNLSNNKECTPNAWKATCHGESTESGLVQCMLREYSSHACRGGLKSSEAREQSILKVFNNGKESTDIHPTSAAIEQCVASWDR